jgi:hypothetical protein
LWEDLLEIDHSQDVGADGRILIKRVFKKWDGEAWIIFLWLRVWTGGGLL